MESEELEVAVLMQRFQWNVNKLYFAGMAGNKPLAGFYLHELEESMEDLAEHPIEENGQRLMTWSAPGALLPLKNLRKPSKKQDPAGSNWLTAILFKTATVAIFPLGMPTFEWCFLPPRNGQPRF